MVSKTSSLEGDSSFGGGYASVTSAGFFARLVVAAGHTTYETHAGLQQFAQAGWTPRPAPTAARSCLGARGRGSAFDWRPHVRAERPRVDMRSLRSTAIRRRVLPMPSASAAATSLSGSGACSSPCRSGLLRDRSRRGSASKPGLPKVAASQLRSSGRRSRSLRPGQRTNDGFHRATATTRIGPSARAFIDGEVHAASGGSTTPKPAAASGSISSPLPS